MPRNVSGAYTLPLPPVEPNTVIESEWANDTLADIAATLDDSLSRSGMGGMTAPFRLTDGSAAAPSLSFIAEPSSGLFRQSSGVIGMSIQGVAQQTWNANGTTLGNVTLLGTITGPVAAPAFGGSIGVGMAVTTPPVAGETTIDIGGTAKAWINLYVGGVRKALFSATSGSTALGTHDAQPLYLLVGNAGRLIIQPTGFVGIGPTAPIALAPLHVRSSTELMRLESTQARGGGNAYMSFFDPSGRKGYIGYGSGGTDDNFFIVNELVSPMLFFNNQSERMRIESTGKVAVNGAASAAQFTVNWVGPGGNGLAVVGTLAGDVSSNYLAQRVDNSGASMTFRLNVTVAGYINHPTLTSTFYSTSSDARMKKNVRPVKDVGKIIDNIPVVSFDWKLDGAHVPVGLIAQDVYGVFPGAVSPGWDSPDGPMPWGMDNAKLVPLMIRELQCLRERVNALEH